MLEKANVPITILRGESALDVFGHVERACRVARQAVGPRVCLTTVYQSTGEGCLHVTAVFARGETIPVKNEVETQLWSRIDFTPLAEPEPPLRERERERAGARGDWMQTATGRAFYPLDPRPEEIDLLWALFRLLRWLRSALKEGPDGHA